MKRFYSLLILILFIISLKAQNNRNTSAHNDTTSYPYWIHMMQDREIPVEAVQQAFNQYWEGRKITKGDGWKPFKRWEWYSSHRVNPDGSRPAPREVLLEYRAFMSQYSTSGNNKSSNGNWTELGPVAMPTNATGQPNGLGRVNGVGFHPSNSNILYIAAPSGGVWKTTDGGIFWTPLTDTIPTLGASDVVIDPSNPNTVYFGSGDRDAADAPGMGVLKSTDAGATWSFANTGMGNETVGDLLIHPTNSNILIAATSSGLYRTTNAGGSWTKTSSVSYHFKDLEFKPGNPNIIYASAYSYTGTYYYRSTNNGQSWTQITTGLPGNGRYVIGVTPANPNYVYIVSGDYIGFVGCYRSTNSGLSFSTQSTSPNILGYSTTGSDNSSQAWYDLAIAIDPSNANTVYVGGINTWKSTNGGASWSLNSHWVGNGGVPAVHADIHSLDFSPVNSRLYSGNDGGIHYTSNGGISWNEISSDLAIAQVYKLGQSASQQNLIINGYQDNGTSLYSNGNWTTQIGGDGMECIIDPSNTNYIYGELYYGDIRRSVSGGVYNQIAGNSVNGITESGAWVTPYILDVNNSNHMIAGYKNLWRSTNVKTASAGSVSWSKLTNNLGGTNSQNIEIIEQSEADDNILYFYREDNKLFRSDNFKNVYPSFTDISSNLPYSQPYSFGSDIEADPANSNIVYMTYYQDVYKSTNKGVSWTDISGNLPSISMNCIVYDTASSNDAIYVGTDAGVYYKDNTMTNWIPFMDNMPNASIVSELEIYYNNNHQQSKIVASTYGRGLWRSDLYSSGTALPDAEFGYDATIICTGDTINFTDSTLNNPGAWIWSFSPSTVTFINSNQNSQNPSVRFDTSGYYTVSLTASNLNGNDTETKASLVKAGGIQVPITETFEPMSSTIGEWSVYNPDNGVTWSLASVAGNTPGNQAAYMDNYNYNSTGARDDLFSPILNLSSYSSALLSFQHAYTRYTGYSSDSLIIYASGDCGATWNKLWAKAENGTGNFATAPDNTYQTSSSFSPSTTSDWCGSSPGAPCFNINLNSYAGNDNILLRFQAYNNYSNNLYLDNVTITGSNTLPVTASFTGSASSVCAGNSITFSNTSQNATSFVWKKDGVVISTNSNISHVFNSAGSYSIRLIASNSSSIDSVSQTITVNPLPGAATIPSGSTNLCINASNTTYTTASITNATSYVWSLSPTSAGAISGNGTSATVDWNNSFTGQASITVKGSNTCGYGVSSSNLNVTINSVPGTPAQPSGDNVLCINPPNKNYTVNNVTGATSYQWNLTPAAAGSISGSSTSASVDWNNSYTGSATISVKASNSCGTGNASPVLNVVINDIPAQPSMPGGPTSMCQNPGTTNYSTASITQANSYNWILTPSSAGYVTGSDTTASVSWNSAFSGNADLKVAALNNCGSGAFSNNLNINISQGPPKPIITQSNDTLYSSSATGNQWHTPSGPISGAVYQYFTPNISGVYFVSVTNSNGCSAQSDPFNYTSSSLQSMLNEHIVKIYPNPAEDILIIEYSGPDKVILHISNNIGEEIINEQFLNQIKLNISHLSGGIYFIKLHLKNKSEKQIIRKVFIK